MSTDYVDVTPKKDGGVLKLVKTPGKNNLKPMKGNQVHVHYVGTLENGDKFDSSRDRGTEFDFTLGQGVIEGWSIGVATMTEGEVAEFKIRSDYGYGSSGSPPKIPGGATLIFEIELISWQGEDMSPENDGTIVRNIIVEGEKLANPNDTSNVHVHAVGEHDGKVFYDRDLTFAIGEAALVDLPDGVDKALKRFCRGEKSVIDIKGGKYTYGRNPPSDFNLPPNAPLKFTLFLKDFEKVPATWEMTSAQKIEAAKETKERGTKFLGEGKLKLAMSKYARVEHLLEYEKSMDDESKKERDALLLAAYLNMALVASKSDDNVKCIKYCDKALEQSPVNVKAMFRKAGAYYVLNDFPVAKELYKKVLELDPNNSAAQQQIILCNQKVKEINDADRKKFKKVFATMSQSQPSTPENQTPSTSKADEPSGSFHLN
ncbi:unnamed protein product [Auanema sp. JU1783]|nr:unnamed protein product [Auanema sp. JU1783]